MRSVRRGSSTTRTVARCSGGLESDRRRRLRLRTEAGVIDEVHDARFIECGEHLGEAERSALGRSRGVEDAVGQLEVRLGLLVFRAGTRSR